MDSLYQAMLREIVHRNQDELLAELVAVRAERDELKAKLMIHETSIGQKVYDDMCERLAESEAARLKAEAACAAMRRKAACLHGGLSSQAIDDFRDAMLSFDAGQPLLDALEAARRLTVFLAAVPCPQDTDGDGGCGRRYCPWCGKEVARLKADFAAADAKLKCGA